MQYYAQDTEASLPSSSTTSSLSHPSNNKMFNFMRDPDYFDGMLGPFNHTQIRFFGMR